MPNTRRLFYFCKPLLITEKLYINNDLLIDRLGSNGRYTNGSNPIHAVDIESNRLFLRDLYESNFLNGNKTLFELLFKTVNKSMY